MNHYQKHVFALLSDVPALSDFARIHPEIEALRGVQQSPQWHPEGDVFVHTQMVMERAAELRRTVERDERPILMLAAMLHDLGKPSTTFTKPDGRITSPGHEAAGVQPTHALLARIGAPPEIAAQVATLVQLHLAPLQFPGTAKQRGYRRLAAKLGDVRVELLAALSKADQWGRTTPDAIARDDSKQVAFLEQYRKYNDID